MGLVQRAFQARIPQSLQVPPIQAKLTIGQPKDKYEKEADRVASQVVQQINTPASTYSTQDHSVQRTAVPEEGKLQAKLTLQRGEAITGGEASSDLESAIARARGGGQPLDPGLQAQMGQAMGADFSGVRVHTDAQSDQLNQSIQAKAFTTGQDVFFRQGAYAPGSRGGQELIAHELTHVVQQGQVKPTLNVNGVAMKEGVSVENNGVDVRTRRNGKERQIQDRTLRKNSSISVQPQAIVSLYTTPIIQRLTDPQELKELEAFYLREIRAIGSPTSQQNQAVYNQAKQEENLENAKKIIRSHIKSWHQFIEDEAFDESNAVDIVSSVDISSLTTKNLQHFTYAKFKTLSIQDRLSVLKSLQKIAGVSDTEYAFFKERASQMSEDEQMGVFYRYHKFADDPASKQIVEGGGLNKSLISEKFQKKAMIKQIKTRKEGLESLSYTPQKRVEQMERFQANAFSTPFIATTKDLAYAYQLVQEYPPSSGQIATILEIVGPLANTFDFESEFQSLNQGLEENKYRTNPDRAKDAEQAEYGIPDLYLRMGETSPMGFRVTGMRFPNEVSLVKKESRLFLWSLQNIRKIDLSGAKLSQEILKMLLYAIEKDALPNLQELNIGENSLAEGSQKFILLKGIKLISQEL
ncbi:MAG: DUF4157 domain-containing protein [Moorea sp. SIO4G3]|nr:DUF4157 domain-containing protein [Moorena sp. SIO4G3]